MRYARNPEVLWRSTSQGPVVLLGDHDPSRLGGLAAAVWEVLDEAMDGEELDRAVGDLAGEPLEVADAMAALEEVGLVVGNPPPAEPSSPDPEPR